MTNSILALLQPVARWVQLPDVPIQPSESRDTGTPTGSQNVDSTTASAAPGQSSITVLAATFVQSASGLMCCIAAAEHESEHGHQLQVYSLLQPVAQAAQAVRSWQKSTIDFGGVTGGSARDTTQGAGTAASAGDAHPVSGGHAYSAAAHLLIDRLQKVHQMSRSSPVHTWHI